MGTNRSDSNGLNEAVDADKHNNQWYYYNPESEVVLVFVHGFFSNSKECWQSKGNIYWPDLVIEDSRLQGASIFLAGYYTGHDSGDYKLAECSAELYSGLSTMQMNGEITPLEKTNIIFVCHSLGGIVARYMLETKHEKFRDKSIGIVLMASPSMGAAYADSFKKLILFYKNGMANQLRAMNELLVDLDSRFKNMIDLGRIENLTGVEAIEHHPLLRLPFLPQAFKPVVTKESAARYFGDPRILPKTNHSTIVKPDSKTHPSHQLLVEFYRNKFSQYIQHDSSGHASSKPAAVPPTNALVGEVSIENKVLFDILSKENIKYYLKRDSDGELERNFALYSLWICGPSACGKTSSARYLIISNGYKPIEICLSHYSKPLSSEQCVKEIIGTLEQMEVGQHEERQCTFQTLVALLSEYANVSPVILYLDEVPVTEDPASVSELIEFVANLITSVKQRTGRSELRIILSSIRQPDDAMMNKNSKIGEQLKIYELDLWSKQELKLLAESIMAHMTNGQIQEAIIEGLIEMSRGSPRALKKSIKDEILSKANLKMTQGKGLNHI